ncbi:MAG: cysteine synthase family protein [Treponema sp.]|jgi:cysteine synthase A|nr:cysteine synthase family protein [Treponema sp.]
MKKLLNNVAEAIGSTPMVKLSRITAAHNAEGNIFAKLEYLNPGFSKKDRVALQMITEAEVAGLLEPGQTVVELTSGNTGTGLAIACVCKGYKFIACMSKGNSTERARMMKALGAEVILVDQMPGSPPGQVSGEDLALVEQRAQEITKERNAFRADQFKLVACNNAHAFYTAEEMWYQTDGQIDALVDFIGSGSTFGGCSQGLRKHKEDIRCYVAEPASAALYSGEAITNKNHKIQGGGYSMELPLIDKSQISGYVQVTDDEAACAARDLAKLEGIFAGFSSGANVCAALKLLAGAEKGKNIVLTLNDSGLKYLSTDLWRH